MKQCKTLLSIVMTIMMLLTMIVPTLADNEETTGTTTTGTITIDNAVVGQTYTIYEILYLESYNATEGSEAYAYKATTAWKSFVESDAIKDVYLKTDAQEYVTWVEGADAANFAKLAEAYAEDTKNNIDNQGSTTATSTVEGATTTTVKFENLNLGYYLVTTSLGSLCSLDTTNPDVTIQEKNSVPTIEKEVKEDSTGNYGDESSAQIGDTVEFKTIVHAKKGAKNYVVHDVMSEGLTFNENSIEVKVGNTALTKDTDYTVSTNNTDNCTFEITFTQTYLDTIDKDTDIVITYTAILNDKAVISTDANTNKTKLVYSEQPGTETKWDETKTYTFKFDIVKTDSNKKLLDGAEFELYDAQTGGNKIALVKESDGTYRVATTAEKNVENFTSVVIEAKDGKATVKGLDANTTYWLEETKAPAGYNKLSGRVEVKIENANLSTTMTGNTWKEGDGGVQITNNSGTELPSTGGIGTTIFYCAGAVLALGAFVLLVTKKRMGKE